MTTNSDKSNGDLSGCTLVILLMLLAIVVLFINKKIGTLEVRLSEQENEIHHIQKQLKVQP